MVLAERQPGEETADELAAAEAADAAHRVVTAGGGGGAAADDGQIAMIDALAAAEDAYDAAHPEVGAGPHACSEPPLHVTASEPRDRCL